MVTGCLRKVEKINILHEVCKNILLVTSENMGLCLFICWLQTYWKSEISVIYRGKHDPYSNTKTIFFCDFRSFKEVEEKICSTQNSIWFPRQGCLCLWPGGPGGNSGKFVVDIHKWRHLTFSKLFDKISQEHKT